MNRMRIKDFRLLTLVAAFLPTNTLRVAGYRLLRGYRIGKGVRIGIGVILDADAVELGDETRIAWNNIVKGVDRLAIGPKARIARGNRFYDASHVEIGAEASIGGGNWVQGATWFERASVEGRPGGFTIGAKSVITSGHLFDVTTGITIGDQTTIAGRGSTFWTHGAGGTRRRPISIGDRCYVGSNCGFANGGSVGDNVLVALGGMVTSPIPESDCVVGGVPAKIIRNDPDWRSG